MSQQLQEKLSANIRTRREALGLTIRAAAEEAGVSEVAWKKWEGVGGGAAKWPRPGSLELIAKVLKTKPGKLLE